MSIQVIPLTLGALSTNSFIVFDSQSREGIIIDPADSGEFILQEVSKKEIKPLAAIATHGHFDHILAATYVTLTLEIPFLMSKKDKFLLERMSDSSLHFTGLAEALPPPSPRFLKRGKKIILGKNNFQVLETPGHTPGSICLYSKENSILFVGDLVFSDGSLGRYDFSYSDKKALLGCLTTILRLPKDTLVFSGHGGQSSIGKLREILKNLNTV